MWVMVFALSLSDQYTQAQLIDSEHFFFCGCCRIQHMSGTHSINCGAIICHCTIIIFVQITIGMNPDRCNREKIDICNN